MLPLIGHAAAPQALKAGAGQRHQQRTQVREGRRRALRSIITEWRRSPRVTSI
jgi:hypothetical protein